MSPCPSLLPVPSPGTRDLRRRRSGRVSPLPAPRPHSLRYVHRRVPARPPRGAPLHRRRWRTTRSSCGPRQRRPGSEDGAAGAVGGAGGAGVLGSETQGTKDAALTFKLNLNTPCGNYNQSGVRSGHGPGSGSRPPSPGPISGCSESASPRVTPVTVTRLPPPNPREELRGLSWFHFSMGLMDGGGGSGPHTPSRKCMAATWG